MLGRLKTHGHKEKNNRLLLTSSYRTSCRNPSIHPSSVFSHRPLRIIIWGGMGSTSLSESGQKCNEIFGRGLVIDSPRVGRGERVASEKKKRRAGRKGKREKREQQQQQRQQRALLGRTPTGLFQYYARWQVSLCPEWHVISVTSSRFDQVIEFSFSTWPRKIGCRDTPTIPRRGIPDRAGEDASRRPLKHLPGQDH